MSGRSGSEGADDTAAAVDDLADRIGDLEEAVSELRRSVSELGRRLALDLPQMLSRHRQAIIEATTGTVPPEPRSVAGQPESESAADGSQSPPDPAANPAGAGAGARGVATDVGRAPDESSAAGQGDGEPARSRRVRRLRRGPDH
ncbi:MAG: hypothetical protein ACT4OS_03605 [Acidimicrobiales bacterium]